MALSQTGPSLPLVSKYISIFFFVVDHYLPIWFWQAGFAGNVLGVFFLKVTKTIVSSKIGLGNLWPVWDFKKGLI